MKSLFLPVILAAVLTTACATAPGFSDVTEKDWKLIKVYVDGTDTLFGRSVLPAGPAQEFFTVKMDSANFSGRGAPNLYSAPYTTGEKQSINIMPARSTLMASFYEHEKLSEHNYFTYLHNTYEWNLVKENLEFLSKTQDGKDVKLVFAL